MAITAAITLMARTARAAALPGLVRHVWSFRPAVGSLPFHSSLSCSAGMTRLATGMSRPAIAHPGPHRVLGRPSAWWDFARRNVAMMIMTSPPMLLRPKSDSQPDPLARPSPLPTGSPLRYRSSAREAEATLTAPPIAAPHTQIAHAMRTNRRLSRHGSAAMYGYMRLVSHSSALRQRSLAVGSCHC